MADVERTEQTEPGREGQARWTRLGVLGLVMVGLGPILMYVAGLLWGMDEGGAFFLVIGLVPLIAAFLVWRFGLWAKVVGAVVAFLAAGSLFWTAFGLATPQSFFDFVPGLLVIPGGIIAIVSCISAAVASRRGNVTTAAIGGERRALSVVLGAVVILAALSAVMTLAGRSTVDAAQADTEVVLSEFEFDQEEYTFAAGTTIHVRNDDPFLHTFTVEEWDVDEALGPGSEVLVEVPQSPGDYVLFCRPHSDPESPDPDDEDMAARVTVQ